MIYSPADEIVLPSQSVVSSLELSNIHSISSFGPQTKPSSDIDIFKISFLISFLPLLLDRSRRRCSTPGSIIGRMGIGYADIESLLFSAVTNGVRKQFRLPN